MFVFPKIETLTKWKDFCQSKKISKLSDKTLHRYYKICEKHFHHLQFRKTAEGVRKALKPNAIPMLNAPDELKQEGIKKIKKMNIRKSQFLKYHSNNNNYVIEDKPEVTIIPCIPSTLREPSETTFIDNETSKAYVKKIAFSIPPYKKRKFYRINDDNQQPTSTSGKTYVLFLSIEVF